ncbi:MAG: TadA family conjugal transfer-associated ATPase [Actinomycetia bacterium]|nr:TadA family conjugal transfer-associated ATPase [Actinomycetes bacterium]
MSVSADVRRSLLLDARPVDAESVRDIVHATGHVVDDLGLRRLTAALSADLQGFGPLEPLLADPSVTDVTVNGAAEVWTDRGNGMELTPIRFTDDPAVRRLAQRLASSAGRRFDDAAPFVDAPLPHGVRLHAMLPPLVDRISLVLRIPRHRAWTLADLVAARMVAPGLEPVLRQLVERRRTFLVTGGTGSGKTTLLNALLGIVGAHERLVIVEDTRELAPQHPHVVLLQTRPPNIEGAGAVTLQNLVRQTLRMRPDRIVVGEVRGAEVIDLLTAFNTGHDGGCGTVHANSAHDLVPRLQALAALGGLSREALHRLVAASIDAVVHLERADDGLRYVSTIASVVAEAESVRVGAGLTATPDGVVNDHDVASALRSTGLGRR